MYIAKAVTQAINGPVQSGDRWRLFIKNTKLRDAHYANKEYNGDERDYTIMHRWLGNMKALIQRIKIDRFL